MPLLFPFYTLTGRKKQNKHNLSYGIFQVSISAVMPKYFRSYLHSARTPRDIAINDVFFEHVSEKNRILSNLAIGFWSDWAPPNFQLLRKLRETILKMDKWWKNADIDCRKITAGRMVGGAGWSRESVEKFLGAPVYTILCWSVCKGDDPHGRIIND